MNTGLRPRPAHWADCDVCGEANPRGLRAQLLADGEGIVLDYTPRAHHCGHPGVVHGGLIAALFDPAANNQPCPEPREVNYFTVIPGIGPAGTQVEAADQRCQGDAGYNNFYGKGIVDAFKAVTDHP